MAQQYVKEMVKKQYILSGNTEIDSATLPLTHNRSLSLSIPLMSYQFRWVVFDACFLPIQAPPHSPLLI